MNPSSIRIERAIGGGPRGMNAPCGGRSDLNAAPGAVRRGFASRHSYIVDQIQMAASPACSSVFAPHRQQAQQTARTSSLNSPSCANSPPGDARQQQQARGEKPTRPLSAYNLFFRYERTQLLLESSAGQSESESESSQEDEDDDKDSSDGDNDNNDAASDGGDESGGNAAAAPPKRAPRPTPSIEQVRYILLNNPFHVDNKNRVHSRTHGKIGFLDLVKHISAQWKDVPAPTRDIFKKLAAEDRERYKRESAAYNMRLQQGRQSQSSVSGMSSVPVSVSVSGMDMGAAPHQYHRHHHHQAGGLQHLPMPMFNHQARMGMAQHQHQQQYHPQKVAILHNKGVFDPPAKPLSKLLHQQEDKEGQVMSIIDRLCNAAQRPNRDPLGAMSMSMASRPSLSVPADDSRIGSAVIDIDQHNNHEPRHQQQQERCPLSASPLPHTVGEDGGAPLGSSRSSPPPTLPSSLFAPLGGVSEEEEYDDDTITTHSAKRRRLDVDLLDFMTTLDWNQVE